MKIDKIIYCIKPNNYDVIYTEDFIIINMDCY